MMKVKDLVKILRDFDDEANVSVFCNGELYRASLDGTLDMNDGEEPNEFALAAETT